MLCYWNDPEETNKVMENGCVYSNDEAYFDEDGDVILLGRKGDVINGFHFKPPYNIKFRCVMEYRKT